ncbi:hypothetical protein [Pedobacter aquae]|uniref:hypothetical protein n=1 Tax=Pedobacter aquae TaxID=2605747 RepID=UPI00143DDB01|nr:hypothetical protein [Pedobacter aquae]
MGKFKFYRHIIALSFLILLGLRLGKMKGVLMVLVVYLALNMATIVRYIRERSVRNGKF